MKCLAFFFALAVGVVRAADPSAVITSVAQDAVTGKITVGYTLSGADAIVTFGGDVSSEANVWTSLPESAFRHVLGDVNKLVTVGTGRTITWTPSAEDDISSANGFRARLTLWSPSAPPDFLSAEIDKGEVLNYYVSEAALPYPITDDYWKMDRILFRKIPAKGVVWVMASISGNRYVRLNHDYYMAVYPYTKLQAYVINDLDTNRTDQIDPDADLPLCPQFRASYNGWRGTPPTDTTSPSYEITGGSFKVLRSRTALKVDFPTEAEWEYAARAGTGAALYTGKAVSSNAIDEVAWYSGNGGKVHEVGLKVPNKWGLHDLLGSVNEWCLDYYAAADNAYFTATSWEHPAEDPVGPETAAVNTSKGGARVTRGSCYTHGYNELSRGLAYRYSGGSYVEDVSPIFGVRFCAPIPGASAEKIQNGTGRWISLDTVQSNSYWNCAMYENPAIIAVEKTLAGADCHKLSLEMSDPCKLNSWPPTGACIIIR